jgi:hypothetical protein
MASTYSAIKIELIGTGDQSGTWGTTTNSNLGTAIEQAIVGKADVTISSASVTLTLTDSNALQDARALFLNLTGTPGSAATLNVPAIEKNYIVKNGTNEIVTIKVAAQTGVAIPVGKTVLVYNNGTDVVTAVDHIPSLTLGAALPVASGGTGITSFGAGVATFLGTPSSANLATAVTDETGSGLLVFATSPTLVTPVLGTPSSGTLSGCTVDGTDAVGFRNTPVNSKSADYTLVLADSGKTIFHPAADNNARTFTIPANSSVAYAVGTVLTFVNLAAADVTIAITTDTMYLAGPGTTGSRTLAEYGIASAVKLASTDWLISGNGLTKMTGILQILFASYAAADTTITADFLVVAGGGGGAFDNGGGGGAGGLLFQSDRAVDVGTAYTVTVGAGGTGGTTTSEKDNGSDSVLFSATALGGGAGAPQLEGPNTGGSGGGARRPDTTTQTGAAATQGNSDGMTGFGFAGGNSVSSRSGGGGGAGEAGNTDGQGEGGDGKDYSATFGSVGGASGVFAGGGGGGQAADSTPVSGGAGGGGSGGSTTTGGTVGTANTGGGGGGGRNGAYNGSNRRLWCCHHQNPKYA